MKIIFNSVGSNYNLSYSLLALRQIFRATGSIDDLKIKIADVFTVPKADVELLYKGRDAIEYILRSYGIEKGDSVITQAFTCFALEEAITRTGAIPIYSDLAKDSLSPSVETLEKARLFAKNDSKSNSKAVIIQHSLGYPADIIAIKSWCEDNNILLIEDLAQAIGAKDSNGDLLGKHADAIILSFGRDKIVDGVSGGAAIFKKPRINNIELIYDRDKNKDKDQDNNKDANKATNKDEILTRWQITKELLYPIVNWNIRFFYPIGLGKLIHFVAKKTGLLLSPIKSFTSEFLALPDSFVALIDRQITEINKSLSHRKIIAQVYYEGLQEFKGSGELHGEKLLTQDDILRGTNLRFPIMVKDTNSLLFFLNSKKVFLSDRWYREAVDCGNTGCSAFYQKHTCPNAERLASNIINLPTHRYISVTIAQEIVVLINKWNKK